MTLTLEEKEKLLEKATKLFNEIREINIRKNIEVGVRPKYYDSNSRYASYGLTYYYNRKSISIFANDIEECLESLKNYINYKKGGEEYINGKLVSCITNYTTNALLDFIYYKDTIIETIKRTNDSERKELNDLLS